MKQHHTKVNHKTNNGFTRNSFNFLSSCIKTVSSGVRSATASVAASISSDSQGLKDQVLWACFDRLELGPSSFKRVLLLGYTSGFQVLDVDDASNVSELVSRRDDPCTFLRVQPFPIKSDSCEGFRASHPLLLIAAGDEVSDRDPHIQHRRDGLARDGFPDSQTDKLVKSPTAVRFYSLRSHNFVHVLRFRSAVYTIRCSPRIVVVALASQIYCFDALTLENKFSVLTYHVPQIIGQGMTGVNVGYGPMDVGPRWLAYASNNPLTTNTGRLSPQTLSPGVSPSTSPSSGTVVARYAVESGKQLFVNLSDFGYQTFSKYYPNGSNGEPTSGWKVSKTPANAPDMDTAGVVIVKDFVTRAIIAHFRAHTSPISALCFDPSATLLVTASIYGNNINIFRIMPSSSQNRSGSQSYNTASSHAHLYKLHRGITSAVIQDICFSPYSQWVSIVSSKGTCHLYVLSPFGGESGLQVQNSQVDGQTLVPILSSPWWSASSYIPPPHPVTLSAISRIRTSNSGWLNTVSKAASSAAGMASTSASSVSAVFHCSRPNGLQPTKRNTLEHLLVYSPSGHLIQYELVPSIGVEATDTSLRSGSGSVVQIQDEDDLRVKAEAVQWWDVCRREDWPEREERIKGLTYGKNDPPGTSDCEEPHERSTLYISNAEVQMNYGRMPTWQNSKIHFFAMNPDLPGGQKSYDDFGGEIEIEKAPDLEIEIKRKELLPVFEQFLKVKPEWNNRVFVGDRRPTSSSGASFADERHSSLSAVYPQPVQNSQFGSPIPVGQLVSNAKNGMIISSSHLLTQNSMKTENASMEISPPEKSCLVNSPSPSSKDTDEREIPNQVKSSNSADSSGGQSNVSSNRSDFSMNVVDESSTQEDPLDFGGYFQEEYCKEKPEEDEDEVHEMSGAVTDVDRSSSPCQIEKPEEDEDEGHEMSGAVTDVDSSSSPCYKAKPKEDEDEDEDGEDDEMLGGIFAFSEEG